MKSNINDFENLLTYIKGFDLPEMIQEKVVFEFIKKEDLSFKIIFRGKKIIRFISIKNFYGNKW